MSEMTLNDYQDEALAYARYGNADYPFLALAEESGEVMGKLAKYVRKHNASTTSALHNAAFSLDDEDLTLYHGLVKELGDVLWQVQACCHELNISLNDLAAKNLDKLAERSERGTIVGEGDNR